MQRCASLLPRWSPFCVVSLVTLNWVGGRYPGAGIPDQSTISRTCLHIFHQVIFHKYIPGKGFHFLVPVLSSQKSSTKCAKRINWQQPDESTTLRTRLHIFHFFIFTFFPIQENTEYSKSVYN